MSTIRFSGLASGLDTDTIVKNLLAPQQLKVDRQKQAQTMIQWKKDAWKDMNKKLYDFYTQRIDKLRLESTFNKTKVTSSNNDVLEVVPNTVLPEGTHKFQVNQLAEAASLAGKVTGQTITTDSTIELEVFKQGAENNKEKITIEVTAGEAFKEIANKMNQALTDAGVKNFTARYDEINKTFFINGKDTGKDQEISITGAEQLGFKEEKDENGNVIGSGNTLATGKNAIFTYNGIEGMESATNKVSVNGAQVTLKGITKKAEGAQPAEVVTLTATQDTDAIYNWVKDFVNDYNKLILETQEKLSEKPRKGYNPLTAEERKAMSEDEIKTWESTIKGAILYKDPTLTDLMRVTRSQLSGIYSIGQDSNKLKYTTLSSLGIVTGDYSENGALHIQGDEDDSAFSAKENKLRKAIEENPQDVIDLLTTLGKDLHAQYSEKLKSSKIKSAMNFYNDKSMDDTIKEHDKNISKLEDRLYTMEKMYYAKFTAMEKMMSRMNSQSSWLAQQLGGQ